jgi:dipeptidyl aminopeptidase/acylaminoacyl peptidase
MQDDITDGVKWLIAEGIADPQRIGIYGASYGGYAALAGISFTPDLYACAVDFVGVSNLFTFLKALPPYVREVVASEFN